MLQPIRENKIVKRKCYYWSCLISKWIFNENSFLFLVYFLFRFSSFQAYIRFSLPLYFRYENDALIFMDSLGFKLFFNTNRRKRWKCFIFRVPYILFIKCRKQKVSERKTFSIFSFSPFLLCMWCDAIFIFVHSHLLLELTFYVYWIYTAEMRSFDESRNETRFFFCWNHNEQ